MKKLMFCLVLACAVSGCSQKAQQSQQDNSNAPTQAEEKPRKYRPEQPVLLPPEVRAAKLAKADLKDHYKKFGIVGTVFRKKIPLGEWGALSDGIYFFKTKTGQVWFVNLETDESPFEQRNLYMVQVSSNLSCGCGYALEDFTTTLPKCVLRQRVLTWAQLKSYFKDKVNDHDGYFAAVEASYGTKK